MGVKAGKQDLYIATDGSDENPGTEELPIKTLVEARDRIRQLKRTGGLPKGGITIWILEGRYHFDKTFELSVEDSGTVDCPIVYKAVEKEKVVFDGSMSIPVGAFKVSADQEILARFCPAARGKVVQTTITDPQLIKLLQNPGSMLNLNGKMMQLARFPNVGYAHIDKILEKGAVYAQGRTFGDPPSYSMEEPIGGEFTIHEQPSGDWEKEFGRVQKAKVTGYLAYDWHKQSHKIASIKEGKIRLLEYSRYGIIKAEKIPRRLFMTNLLCELDQPGEWYYDDDDSVLFIWPFEPVDESTELGVWAGPAFAELSGVSYTTFQGLTIQGTVSGQGMIVLEGGEHNRIAGCTLKNSTRTGSYLKAENIMAWSVVIYTT